MAIRTTNRGGTLELVPEGMHFARCFRLIDCGTVNDAKWGKARHLGWIFWELPAAMKEGKDGEGAVPHTIGKRYAFSHNGKSSLRQDLESWYGRRFDDKQLDDAGGFDLERLIGRPALLNVVHSEDGQYANVATVNPLPAGMECPPAINATQVFGFDPYDPVVFSDLSERMQEFIRGSAEWQLINNGHGAGSAAPGRASPRDDDLPYGAAPAPLTRQVMPPPGQPAGKFDDMADDIPF